MALIDDIRAYYKLEETSGTRYDETANDYDLTDYNTVGYATGKIGNGADFERDNSESLYLGNNLGITGDDALSFSCWIKAESNPTNGNYAVLVSHSDISGTDNYSMVAFYNDSGTIKLGVESGYGFIANYTFSPTAGTWYHIVMTRTTGNLHKIYVNGTEVSSESISKTSLSTNVSVIGADYSHNAQFFDGVIDEVGIWKKVLTTDEITALYNSGNGFQYPFSSASGPANLKTYNTNTKANTKTINTNPIANVKTLDTNV